MTSLNSALTTTTIHPDLYEPGTPLALIQFFESQLEAEIKYPNRKRTLFQFHYGNPVTGRAWDEHDEGYISLSGGRVPALIVLPDRKSKDGTGILIGNIVKITSGPADNPRIWWRHARFHSHEDVAPEIIETNTDTRALRRVSLRRRDDSNTG